MPSDVVMSPSPFGSCMKKPLATSAVTTPPVIVTVWPLSGEVTPLPLTCMIVTGTAVTVSAMFTVPVWLRLSVIVAASVLEPGLIAEPTVTPASEKFAWSPLSVSATEPAPPIGLRSTLTEVMLVAPVPGVASTERVVAVAPSFGTEFGLALPVPLGLPLLPAQTLSGVYDRLRGFGAVTSKSLISFPVFVQPPVLRTAAVVLLSTPTGLLVGQLAEPKPTTSTTAPPLGHAIAPSAVLLLNKATLPFVPDSANVPVTSPTTSTVPPVPAASLNRKY